MIYFVLYKNKVIYSQVEEEEFHPDNNSIDVIDINLKFRAHDETKFSINNMDIVRTQNIYPEDINMYLESVNPKDYSFNKLLYKKLKEESSSNNSDNKQSYTPDLEKKINELEVQLSSEKAANQASLIGLMEISNRVRDLESKVIK